VSKVESEKEVEEQIVRMMMGLDSQGEDFGFH
jgi:hypothetical protein